MTACSLNSRASIAAWSSSSSLISASARATREKDYPRLHGQHYEYLLRQLIWIQEGKRRNANKIMLRKNKRLKLEDFELIADYVSRLAPPAELVAEPGWKNPDYWDK